MPLTKKIIIITTGGTIASSKSAGSGFLQSGVIDGTELANRMLVNKGFNYKTIELFNLPSAHLTLEHLKEIALKIKEVFKDKTVGGVVITHGTDTLEETAYFLSLTTNDERPIVLTGSQLPPFEQGSDALNNFTDALTVAVNSKSMHKGVLVVFNKKIFVATEVVKLHSADVDGFVAPASGPIGHLDRRGEIFYERTVQKQRKYSIENLSARVFLIKFALGMGSELLDVALQNYADGLVLEGFGTGQIPLQALDAVREALNRKIPVVLTTRCIQGGIKYVYDYPGSAHQLKQMGVIIAEELSAEKACLKLILALGSNLPFDE